MLQSEYIRNLNCNYERVLLDKKPEENRYQYCIVTRGGIRGLLPCSLRYINGQAYLYYDISSTQSVAQLYARKAIGRQWMKDFLWGMRRIKQELGRFLLDDANLLWYPEQIFQDLEKFNAQAIAIFLKRCYSKITNNRSFEMDYNQISPNNQLNSFAAASLFCGAASLLLCCTGLL